MEDEAVALPLIENVFIDGQDAPVPASSFLEQERREFSILRAEFEDAILRGKPIARCAACHRPVKPRLSVRRRRFFRHHEGDGDCPFQTSGGKNQQLIDAMRYNGQKEGPDHIHLKSLLEASLRSDLSFDQETISVERRWWGVTAPAKWKKPDISAEHNGLPITFEVQLSTTFLNVMAERRRFYLENGGLLIWVFKRCERNPRQFQDDIFYNNNSNLFVVDGETTQLSRENGQLMLRCHYLEPILEDGEIREEWREQIIPFNSLTIEREHQRAFFFDTEGEMRRLEGCLDTQRVAFLRDSFLKFWEKHRYHGYKSDEALADYLDLSRPFEVVGIYLPVDPDQHFARFSCLALSAKEGKPVGFDHGTLLEVANFAYDKCRPLLWYFCTILKSYGTWETLMEQDRNAGNRKRQNFKPHKSWKEKLDEIREGIRVWRATKTGNFPEERKFDQLFSFLFPDLSQWVQSKKESEN